MEDQENTTTSNNNEATKNTIKTAGVKTVGVKAAEGRVSLLHAFVIVLGIILTMAALATCLGCVTLQCYNVVMSRSSSQRILQQRVMISRHRRHSVSTTRDLPRPRSETIAQNHRRHGGYGSNQDQLVSYTSSPQRGGHQEQRDPSTPPPTNHDDSLSWLSLVPGSALDPSVSREGGGQGRPGDMPPSYCTLQPPSYENATQGRQRSQSGPGETSPFTSPTHTTTYGTTSSSPPPYTPPLPPSSPPHERY